VQIVLAFRFAFAILESLKRNALTGNSKMKEYLVTFENAEMIVCGRDKQDAQDNAIQQMEDAGEVHGAIIRIRFQQNV
jgi:hypothetical protein